MKTMWGVCVCFWVLFFTGCGEKEVVITGKTMGTTYHIKAITSQRAGRLKDKIDQRLEEINRSMSTFRKDSEITRFNTLKTVGEKLDVSDDFLRVMIVGRHIHEISGGTWDGTVYPLVKLWGFAGSKIGNAVPKPEEIRKSLADVGFDQIEISENHLRKKKPDITLDLASIAKGYGVDQIAELLIRDNIGNFLVEIGGEVCASGVRTDGKPWKVGINTPKKDAAVDEVWQAVELRNKSMATSGDYRNFFEVDGKQYAHILDPRTGYPVSNGVVSASVIADNCTFADGLATALVVMGHEKAIELVNRLDDTECMIIVRQPDGKLKNHYSEGFVMSGE